MSKKFDKIDRLLLAALQRDASKSQRELAEEVGLSQNACWRRLNALRESGVIIGQTVKLDSEMLGLNLTAFVLVKTRHHSPEWLSNFRKYIKIIPDIVDCHRVTGNFDYVIKIVTSNTKSLDAIYHKLIESPDLASVTSYISMESLVDGADLSLS